MWEFNLVATLANDGRYRRLLEELNRYGEFRRTEFLGVILGRVADRDAFIAMLQAERQKRLTAFQDLGRLIPIDRIFTFTVSDFLQKLQEATLPYLGRLSGRRFYVRLERRGHKGEIISPEIERALDAYIIERIATAGGEARIDFADPEEVIAVETFGDRAGVGLLSREIFERYEFVRIG